MRGHTQTILLLAVAAVAAAGGYFGYSFSHESAAAAPTTEPADESPAIPVAVEPLRRGDLSDMATAYGIVQSRPGQVIAAAVSFESIPTSIHVTTGEWVEAGATLIDLQPSPDAALQLRQAEQALAAAEKNAEQARHRRDEQLATNADVTTAEQAVDSARTQLNAQTSRGVGAVHSVKAAQAGIVTAIAAQPGQIAAAGTPLITITPADSIEVKLSVDPADIAALKPGATVMLQPSGSDNALAGAVRQQSKVLNSQRLCDVFISCSAAASLSPGTFVEGAFARRVSSGLIVPRAATQLEGEDWCVYTVKDDKAIRHTVKIGATDGHDIIVAGEGLEAGDSVVVERDGELQDSAAVKVEAPDEDAK